jgi:uncharacterized protein YbaP (TraB family)
LTCFGQNISSVKLTNNQLLWQISGNGLKKPSYLFGSYHSNDPRVFRLSDSTYAAFITSEAVVLEADIYQLFADYDIRVSETKIKFDSNGKSFTSDKNATKTKYGSEDGRPQFLDLYFQQLAQNMQKKFYPLETIEEQLDAFESLYEKSITKKSLVEYQIIQDKLFQAYLNGDVEYVRATIEKQLSESTSAYDRLIVKRNYKMALGIDSFMKKQSLFVAIGAGHLAGNEGVINLLRKKGYHVRQVVPTFKITNEELKAKIFPYHTYQYTDTKYGFSGVFGSIPMRDTNALFYRIIYQELGQGNAYIVEIEQATDSNIAAYVDQVIMPPENAKITKVMHQNTILAYEGVGYEYGVGLSWKRVFIHNGILVKLICY